MLNYGIKNCKSIGLGKFGRINLSKTGISLSSGIKGSRVSINSKGVIRKSIGIPGTGIYYSDQHKIGGKTSKINKNKNGKEITEPYRMGNLEWLGFLVAGLLLIAFIGSTGFIGIIILGIIWYLRHKDIFKKNIDE